MECMLQWLDEIEDLLYCVPMCWVRIRAWLLLALSAILGALVAISSTPLLSVAPAPAAAALLLLVLAMLGQMLRMLLLNGSPRPILADRA